MCVADGISPIGTPTSAARCHDQGLTKGMRVQGSNVTMAPATRAGSPPLNAESMRTVPLNQSVGALAEGCEPLRLISISYCRAAERL